MGDVPSGNIFRHNCHNITISRHGISHALIIFIATEITISPSFAFDRLLGRLKPQKYCVTGVLNCLVITNYMSGHIKHRSKFPCFSRGLCANIVSDIHGQQLSISICTNRLSE